MQVRRGAGLHARLPRRYGRKSVPPLHPSAAPSPSHSHHAFLLSSCQATPTAPRRKTCLTTSVKSPTTSCESGVGRGGGGEGHAEAKRKPTPRPLATPQHIGGRFDDGGGTIRILRRDDRRLLLHRHTQKGEATV